MIGVLFDACNRDVLNEIGVLREDEVDESWVIDLILTPIRVEIEFDVILLKSDQIFFKKTDQVSLIDLVFVPGYPVEQRLWTKVISFGEHFLIDLYALFGLDDKLHHLEDCIHELVLEWKGQWVLLSCFTQSSCHVLLVSLVKVTFFHYFLALNILDFDKCLL